MKLSTKIRRDDFIAISVSPDEKVRAKAAAEEASLTLSSWARQALMRALPPKVSS